MQNDTTRKPYFSGLLLILKNIYKYINNIKYINKYIYIKKNLVYALFHLSKKQQ